MTQCCLYEPYVSMVPVLDPNRSDSIPIGGNRPVYRWRSSSDVSLSLHHDTRYRLSEPDFQLHENHFPHVQTACW